MIQALKGCNNSKVLSSVRSTKSGVNPAVSRFLDTFYIFLLLKEIL